MSFTDADGIPVTYLSFSQEESADGSVFILKIACVVGHVLKADPNPDVAIFGRPAGSGSYVNLFTNPIDLTPYAGTDAAFQLFIRTDAVSVPILSTAIGLTAGSP